jgi:hypothetical protein
MSLLDAILAAWAAVTAFVVAACRVSSRGDARLEQADAEPSEFAP